MMPRGRKAPRVVRGGAPSRETVRLIAAYAGLAAFVWLLVTAGLGIAVDDTACASACHTMRAYDTAADGSAHASIGCQECHATPGPAGALVDGVALQRRVLAAAVGRAPASAPVSDAACRTCHVGVSRGTVVAGGIAVRHSDFWATPCADCHGGTAHAVSDRRYRVPEMDDCLQCHSASANEPSQCSRCHVPGSQKERPGAASWAITHGPTWAQTHGLGDSSTCVSCHAPAYCARCHGVALPHPTDWPQVHGREMSDDDLRACQTCHNPDWCVSCHQIEMPHPAGFLPAHGPEAERLGGDTCVRCHTQQACDDCHFRSAHPDIPGGGVMHGGSQ